jgi:hypothetical protein
MEIGLYSGFPMVRLGRSPERRRGCVVELERLRPVLLAGVPPLPASLLP